MAGENEIQEDDVRDLVPVADATEPIETRQRAPEPEHEPAKDAAKEPPKEVRHSLFEDKRAAAVEKVRQQRRDSGSVLRYDVHPEAEQREPAPEVPVAPEPTQEQQDAVAAEAAVAAIPAPKRTVLKVNGREIEVDQAQLEENARKSLASDDILNEAKRARDEARRELAEIQTLRAAHSAGVQPQPVPAHAQVEDPKPTTDAELDEIITAIQLGDQKDAALALSKHGDIIERRLMQKIGNIDERIAATTQRFHDDARVRAETQSTLDSFISENPDFSQSQRRVEVLFETSVEVMRDNLFALGVSADKLKEFADTNGMAPQAAISVAYRKLRAEGHQLPDPSKVLVDAANRVRTDFGMPVPQKEPAPKPAPAPVVKQDNTEFVAQRIERKQAMAPQPRRANISPGAEAAPSEQSLDQKRVDAVRQMRAFRRGR